MITIKRFITVNLKFDVEIWSQWAEKQGIDSRCINFLLMTPELVTEECNGRSIVTFFNALKSITDFSKNLALIQMIGEGSVGSEFTTMFTTFIHNKLDLLISPKTVLLSDDENVVIQQLKSAIGSDDDYRADIASVLTTRIINYAILYAEKNTINQKIIDRIITLGTDTTILTLDLQYILIKKIISANKPKFQKIMNNAKIMEMVIK